MALPTSFCNIATYIKNQNNLGVQSELLMNNNPYKMIQWESQSMCLISALYKILQNHFTSASWGGIATDRASVMRTVDNWGADLDVNLPLISATTEDGNLISDWYDLPSGYTNHIITDHEWQELIAFCGDLNGSLTPTKLYATMTLGFESSAWLDYGNYNNAVIYTFGTGTSCTLNSTSMTSSNVRNMKGFRWWGSNDETYGSVSVTQAIFPYAIKLELPSNNKIYYVDDTEPRFAPWWGSHKITAYNQWLNSNYDTGSDGYQSQGMSNKYGRICGATSSATAYYVGNSTDYALGLYSPQTGWENYNNNYVCWDGSSKKKHKMVAPNYSGVDATFDRVIGVDDYNNFVTYFGVKSGETELYFNGNFAPNNALYQSGSTCDFLPQNLSFYCVLNSMRWGREEKYGYKQINNSRLGQW